MKKALRTFLSYDIDEPSMLSKVANFQRELVSTGADLKLVKPDLLHFTVRFFGEIEESLKERIIHTLNGSVPQLDIEVKFKGIGTFPNDRRISVIWIGAEEDTAKILSEQARLVNTRLEKEIDSLPREKNQRFNPHVTIARVKTGRNKVQLVQFLQQRRDEDFGSARIKKLKLKKSVLTPEGPNYTDLRVF